MSLIEQSFAVQYHYRTYFTEGLFQPQNPLLSDVLAAIPSQNGPRKCLFVLDSGVAEAHPSLSGDIAHYTAHFAEVIDQRGDALLVPGGEACKNDTAQLNRVLTAIHERGICRHSYVIAIGGGAVLDMAGFAAAIAHRGVRLIRVPTTVLAQNDSGVGVKTSFNFFGKKNFLGTFQPPVAVLNDWQFLTTLSDRDWRSGIAEAIKVALIQDKAFFDQIVHDCGQLNARDLPTMNRQIYRCAQLHIQHIANRDPFESGSSRPLDFGHWAAHKLEQLTHHQLRHGEAVAIGIALDVTYSWLAGRIAEAEWRQVIDLISGLGFELFVPELAQQLAQPDHPDCVLSGLQEFREHLGGQLTIMLLDKLGQGVEVHEMDLVLLRRAIAILQTEQAALRQSSLLIEA